MLFSFVMEKDVKTVEISFQKANRVQSTCLLVLIHNTHVCAPYSFVFNKLLNPEPCDLFITQRQICLVIFFLLNLHLFVIFMEHLSTNVNGSRRPVPQKIVKLFQGERIIVSIRWQRPFIFRPPMFECRCLNKSFKPFKHRHSNISADVWMLIGCHRVPSKLMRILRKYTWTA